MAESNYPLLKNANISRHHFAEFCYAMASRGEIVKRVVQDSGISISRLAEKIGISRAQLYTDFSNPEMSFDRILAIGKVLHHDFSLDFKDIPSGLVEAINGIIPPTAAQLQDCQSQLIQTQAQLISAMQTIALYREKYGPVPA